MTARRRGSGKAAEEGGKREGGRAERGKEGERERERESGQMAGGRGGSFTSSNSHTSLVESCIGAALLLQSQEMT